MKLFLSMALLCTSNLLFAQNEFITTWETTTNDESITIPTTGTGYNYDVDWDNDGTFDDLGVSGDITHIYPLAGVHTVLIRGAFPRIIMPNAPIPAKLLSVEQWGNIAWNSMEEAFSSCPNLVINAIDAPDLSNVSNMNQMFANATSLNQSINHWDTSNVTEMNFTFLNTSSFNQPLNNWDVSNVVFMLGMFLDASAFNQNLDSWEVGNNTVFSNMFQDAVSFNQDLNGWDVSSASNMRYMFRGATVFNGDISGWNVSDVETMEGMFINAINFNQDISGWDVSSVTNMRTMFNGTSLFNIDIGIWDVGNVEDMGYMFSQANAFNQNLNTWNVSNVTDMTRMFSGAIVFNSDIGSWNVSSVTNMSGMFNTASFNQNIGSWNVGAVIDMENMFLNAKTFNQNIGNWDVSSVNKMSFMFTGAFSFNQDIGNWNVGEVTSMSYMFLVAFTFNQDIGGWDVSKVTNMSNMFNAAESFNQDIGIWDVSNVQDMSFMLISAKSFNQDLGNWDISSVNTMNTMLADVHLSPTNYDATLIGWQTLGPGETQIPMNITFDGGNSAYCAGETARTDLINTYGWTITDAGLDCNTCNSDTTFSTALGWDNGSPTLGERAIISNDYDSSDPANGSFEACELLVTNNATLTIEAGDYIRIDNNITVDAGATLLVKHQGSVVQVDPFASVIKNGTINVELTTPPLKRRDFMVMGSPMDAETRTDVFTNAFLVLNQVPANFLPHPLVPAGGTNFADDNNDYWNIYNGAINPGEAYIVRPQAGYSDPAYDGPPPVSTIEFDMTYAQGTLNNGLVQRPIYFNGLLTNPDGTPNALANPYASSIDANLLISGNSTINEVYFWEHLTTPNGGIPGANSINFSMDDISMYNGSMGVPAANDSGTSTTPNGVIATGQGFGIKATFPGTVSFTNNMRLNTGNTTLRAPQGLDKLTLKIRNDRYELGSYTGIAFRADGTALVDDSMDSNRISTFISLYTHLLDGSERLGIQTRESFEDGIKIPMGFSSQIDAEVTYVISIENIEGNQLVQSAIYLIDHQEQQTIDLTLSEYEFESSKGTFDERFTLLFEGDALGNSEVNSEKITLYPNPTRNIVTLIAHHSEVKSIQLFDLQGRMVKDVMVKSGKSFQIDVSDLTSSVYLVAIETTQGITTKRLLKN